jgi:hypothetical protein
MLPKEKRVNNEKILEMLKAKISSKEFLNSNRVRPEDFSRRRKLGFAEIIKYQLITMSKSLTVEINEFIKELGKGSTGYTKQAYSKARMKIRHEGYIELNDQLQTGYYQEAHKEYKGYRLLGIDGSKIELPHEKNIGEYFGKANKNEEMINISWSTILYDLQNKLVVDARLNQYGKSERFYAIEQLKALKSNCKQRQDIIVADRGFPSLELFAQLRKMGFDYVIRYNGEQFLKETGQIITSQEDDLIIEISLREGKKRSEDERIKKLLSEGISDKISLRILRIELSNGVKEYLITSLIDKEKFNQEDFKEIYGLRWNQEVYYDFQKNVIEVENFSGKTVESILQDYHSRVLVGNIHSMIITEAEEQIKKEVKENPKLKYTEYQANRAVTYGIMKTKIYKMLDEENLDWEKEYDELVKIASTYKIPVRKNRKYPRKKKGNLKYPINKKKVI